MADLTEHFSVSEFVVSKEHPNLLPEITQSLTDTDRLKMFYLSRMYLELLRNVANAPITILSGKRSLKLNTAIGGAKESDHLFHNECAAVDFTCQDIDSLFADFSEPSIHFPIRGYGQLIWYPNQHFAHISLASRRHFEERLISEHGKYRRID